MSESTRIFDKYTKIWRELGFYERFEQVAAIFLSVLVSIIVVFACLQVAGNVYDLMIGKVNLAASDTFRNLFAGILTVLIALEFNHSIVQVIERKQSIVQVRIIVQIAILAIVRKFILIDITKTEAMVLIGLGVVVFSLAALHWVIRVADKPPSYDRIWCLNI